MSDELAIPLIDISALGSPTPASRVECGAAILHAFESSGFLYISNWAQWLPPDLVARVFDESKRFFQRPQPQKDSLAWTTPQANRGYVSHGREKVSQKLTAQDVDADRQHNPDLKESFEIGRDDEDGHPNQWPDKLDDAGKQFRVTMTDFFLRCKDVHRLLMSAIALGLGLDESYFDEYTKVGDNTLRLLHYPPVSRETFLKNPNQVRAGAHSDYGSLTLLFQDDRGGLQVQTATGEWKNVTPLEGTIVVNAGDLLSRWSNDRVRSTIHRVVEPPQRSEQYSARYSIAYFANPDFQRVIEALPNTHGHGVPAKYEPIKAGDYLVQRLTATY